MGSKISIKSLDDGTALTAAHNPDELHVEQPVSWTRFVPAHATNDQGIALQFKSAQGRTMSFTLLFDGDDVAARLATLERLASIWKPGSTHLNERRPHRCVASWGTTVSDFRCVIASLSTVYTMFSDDGTPLRATCAVKLEEADVVSVVA